MTSSASYNRETVAASRNKEPHALSAARVTAVAERVAAIASPRRSERRRIGPAPWQTWRSRHDLDAAESATAFIFPAVYLKISRLAPNDPDLPRLRAAYRFAWSRTQIALRTVGEVVRLLQRASITATVLKGIPLILFYYRDAGARRMYDVDVLIRPSEVNAAAELLASAGWAPKVHLPPEHLRPYSPACAFGHPQFTELDLHWRPFTIDCPAEIEEQFHQRTLLREVQGVPVRVPDATDLLLFTCFHSRKRDSQARLPLGCRCPDTAVSLRSARGLERAAGTGRLGRPAVADPRYLVLSAARVCGTRARRGAAPHCVSRLLLGTSRAIGTCRSRGR